ncbi:MAG: hypothetical protein AAB562_00445 [Patescibacteria group bacterium]
MYRDELEALANLLAIRELENRELQEKLEAMQEAETGAETARITRLQFDFSGEAYRRLMEILDASGLKTRAELVRDALRLYEWCLKEKRDGWKLRSVNGDIVMEVVL